MSRRTLQYAVCRTAAIVLVVSFPAQARVWPGAQWAVASPQSQGMSSTLLDEAEAYAQKYGGASGCIVRHGYLVKEWGSPTSRADIKSATKGSFGTTILGLAHEAGLVGLDDGRPPRLIYRPGTKGLYSNDTANMLAELLTRAFQEDLATVVRRTLAEGRRARGQESQWAAHGRRRSLSVGAKCRELAARLVQGPWQILDVVRLEIHDELRLSHAPELRQEFLRCARPIRVCLFARRGDGPRAR